MGWKLFSVTLTATPLVILWIYRILTKPVTKKEWQAGFKRQVRRDIRRLK